MGNSKMKIVTISLMIIANFLINSFMGLKLKKDYKDMTNNEFIKEVLQVKKDKGHYEKYIKIDDVVVFVPGDKPSGIPGAFVVSNDEAQGKDPRKPEFLDPTKQQRDETNY